MPSLLRSRTFAAIITSTAATITTTTLYTGKYPASTSSSPTTTTTTSTATNTVSLSLVRGTRAIVTWGRLVLNYKLLALYRPGSHATPEERLEYETRRDKTHHTCAQAVLELCQKNGGLFIKMGQHATSLRPAIPEIYIDTLRVLQTDAPQKSTQSIMTTIRQEITDPDLAADMIAGLDPEPLGSASLAQVHSAQVRGQRVAIKVQHANLVNVIASDLFVIKWLDRAASELFRADNFTLAHAVSEFEANVKQELDFVHEADNATRARELISHHPTLKDRVYIPRVYRDMSSKKVLTMELVQGIPIREVTNPQHRKQLANTVIDLFSAMIFTFGVIHLDPHFGNFLVCNNGQTLALLDHGLYCDLKPDFMRNHALLWRSMAIGDGVGVARAVRGMGAPQYEELLPLILTSRPVKSRARLGQKVPVDELAAIRKQAGFETGMSLLQFAEIASDVPVDFLFVLRTMHLVKDLHMELGGDPRNRLYDYTVTAAAFPDSIPTQTWTGMFQVYGWKLSFAWNESKLWLQQWLFYRDEVNGGGRFSVSGLIKEKMEGATSKPGRIFRAMKIWRRAKEKVNDGTKSEKATA